MPAELGKPRKPNEASRKYTIYGTKMAPGAKKKPKKKLTAAEELRQEAEVATANQRRLKQEFLERQRRSA